jgi:SAV_6107-like HEPN
MPDPLVHLDLRRARSAIVAAELAETPSDRYVSAHLAALQVAAVVLAWRGNRALTASRGRPRNAWRMLADVAPEFAEWAAFFAATEAKRDAVRAGATTSVSAREADDLIRDAQCFLAIVERSSRFSVPLASRDTPTN